MKKTFEEQVRCLDDPPPVEKPLVVPTLETHLQERRSPVVTWQLLLMVFAFVLFVLAGFGYTVPRLTVNLGWLGLACWILTHIIPRG